MKQQGTEDSRWYGSSAGGSRGFAPGIDMMYCVTHRDHSTHLVVAVLMRRISPSDASPAAQASEQPHPFVPPDPGKQPRIGSGASLGSHYLYCDAQHEWLWLDDQQLASLEDANIVLLVESGHSVSVAGTDLVDGDFGEEFGPEKDFRRLDKAEFTQRVMQFWARMHEVVNRSVTAAQFMRAG